MASWAERFDAYRAREANRRREDDRRNSLSRILSGAYEEPQAEQPAIYGPVQEPYIGGVEPNGVGRESIPGRTGGLNMQNAIGAMLRGGFGPEALQLAQTMATRRQNQLPSDVQETDIYMSKPEDWRSTHMALKRAPTILNLGGTQMVRDPRGGASESYAVTPKPEQMPSFRGAQARAVVTGKDVGEQEVSLNEMQSNLPRLETVVGQLSELGKNATYTKSGQLYDVARREIGMDPRAEAIARREYIAKVDNEVLPLLRMTFGAQFTQKEGESLKATLGDTNASPAEKDAVLRSFIDSKRAQVETQKRKAGIVSPQVSPTVRIPSGAKTGTKNGRKVFSTDGGKSVFYADTGERVQ